MHDARAATSCGTPAAIIHVRETADPPACSTVRLSRWTPGICGLWSSRTTVCGERGAPRRRGGEQRGDGFGWRGGGVRTSVVLLVVGGEGREGEYRARGKTVRRRDRGSIVTAGCRGGRYGALLVSKPVRGIERVGELSSSLVGRNAAVLLWDRLLRVCSLAF